MNQPSHRRMLPAMLLTLAALVSNPVSGLAWSSEPPGPEETVAQLPIAQLPEEGQPPAPEASVNDSEASTPAPVAETTPEAVAEVTDAGEFESAGAAASPPGVSSPEVRELSVPPVTQRQPLLPADAPAWIHAPADVSSRVHRLFVGSLPTSNRQEAESDEALQHALELAVANYLDEHVQPGSSRIQITADFIQQQLVDPASEYLLSVPSPAGTEYQKWVVLRITPEQREYFTEQYQQLQQRERLSLLGLGLASVLTLTGLANLVFTRRQKRYALADTTPAPGMSPTLATAPSPASPLAAALPVVGAGQPRMVHLLRSSCKTRKSASCCNWTAAKVAKALFVAGVIFTVVSMVKVTKSYRESGMHVRAHSPEKVEVKWNEKINQEIRDEINREIQKSFGHWK